jgi:MoaA/NifB/PqqE/SkfB family radical SAM enzyme
MNIQFISYDESRFKDLLTISEYDALIESWLRYRENESYQKIRNRKRNRQQRLLALRMLKKRYYLVPHLMRMSFLKTFTSRPLMRAIELSITYRCNCACDQCSCRLTFDPLRKELNLEEYIDIIDQALPLGAFQFNLTGGEPLLDTELVLKLIRYIKSKHRLAHLCSNGVLLLDVMDELAAAGLDSLEMGLDSADPPEHDSNRHENSFELVRNCTHQARARGISVLLNTIITTPKIENLDMFALGQVAKAWDATLQITPPCLSGSWKGKTEILLNPEERLFHQWYLGLPHVRSDIFSGMRQISCSAGREKLAVTPYGDVLPCSLIQLPYGNVRETSMTEIWDKVLSDSWYKKEQACVLGCPTSFDDEFIRSHSLDKIN